MSDGICANCTCIVLCNIPKVLTVHEVAQCYRKAFTYIAATGSSVGFDEFCCSILGDESDSYCTGTYSKISKEYC